MLTPVYQFIGIQAEEEVQHGLVLEILDDESPQEPRRCVVDRVEVTLGKRADIRVSGTYASREHLRLKLQKDRAWVSVLSTNGVFVDRLDNKLARNEQCEVFGSDVLRLAWQKGVVSGGPHDYPIVKLLWKNTTHEVPVGSTPTVGLHQLDGTAIGVLEVRDAAGSRKIPIDTLPFLIGRSVSNNYVVPKENTGVAQEHLVIQRVHAHAISVWNKAAPPRYVTEYRGQPQQVDFNVAYDEEIVLRGAEGGDQPVIMKILPAGPQ